jgi:hypothetical protein
MAREVRSGYPPQCFQWSPNRRRIPAKLAIRLKEQVDQPGGNMSAQVSQTGAPTQEQTLVTTIFGTVTNKRVIYNRARGWFSGGSREDIPLAHVTSVRIDIKRHLLWGILLVIIGLPMALAPGGGAGAQVVGAVLVAIAVLVLWGSPTVHVNTAGQDKNRASGFPWQREQATSFVEAIRQQLVQRQ